MNEIKIYVILNEKINQYVLMVVDNDLPLWSDIVTQPYLQQTLNGLKVEFGNSGRPVSVHSRY